MINPSIFREYDIRGIVGTDFDLKDTANIARSYASYLTKHGGRSVAVGCDCRETSPAVREAFVGGLKRSGLQVTDVGMCPTPLLYFGIRHLALDGGVMITASHNPPEYNGFKICLGPDTISGDEIQRLKQILEEADFIEGSGSEKKADILEPYCNHLLGDIRLERPVRLAVDAGNGTGGITSVPVFRGLGCETVHLFMEPDGRFPNHEPDPTVPANMETLSRAVVENGLELGIAFDGDADRLGVVDENGRIIYGDMLLAIFARDILADNPGAKIIGEVKCSQLLYDDIKARGGAPIMWKAGHSLMKQKLKAEAAMLAGEMSGHFFFNHRYFGFDDAVYAACRLLELASRRTGPISSLIGDMPVVYNTPELRLDCPEHLKFPLVDIIRKKLGKENEIIDLDGVRVVYPDGWALVRASNTSPVIVLRFEAMSRHRLDEIQQQVGQVVESARAELEN